MEIDLRTEVVPKSDQLNSDDLIAGPITIEITRVVKNEEAREQRTSIYYKGDRGKPYKPGKSMIDVMGQIWGWDGALYVGRFLTLYRDPDVTFGKTWKGAIRISHMSHIDRAQNPLITMTRGIKRPHHVEPLKMGAKAPAPKALASPSTTQPATGNDLVLTETETATAKAIAKKGTKALEDWWGTLDAPARKRFVNLLDTELKRIAEDFDAMDPNDRQP